MRLGHGGVGDRHLVRVVCGAADEILLGMEIGNAGLGVKAEQPFHLGHDFGADAVAGKEEQTMCWHESALKIAERGPSANR